MTETSYPYVDESGTLLYENVRVEQPGKDKTFYYRRPDNNGGWIHDLAGVRRVPFRLDEIRNTIARGERIFAAEGEKNALDLVRLGLCATSTKNLAPHAADLAGAKEIVVLYDTDKAGRVIRDELIAALRKVCNVRVVHLVPDDPRRNDHYDVSDWIAAGHTKDELMALVEDATLIEVETDITAEPPADLPLGTDNDGAAINTASLLDDIVAFIRSYIFLPPAAAFILALFVLHEHALDAFETTPYILISSAEKRSGKSHLLDVLKLLLARPWKTVRVTASQVVREIGANHSTLMLDEADTVFGTKGDSDPGVPALRGVIDAAFEKDGEASVNVPSGNGWKVLRLRVFSSMVFASIHQRSVPDTVRDRGIAIRLTRKTREEKVKRFYRREVKPLAAALRGRVAAWGKAHVEELSTARPAVVDALEDRAFDVVEPLLAIADLAGGVWPARALDAIKDLLLGDVVRNDSLGVCLLSDIRRVRDDMRERGDDPSDRIFSETLVKSLCELEEPAADWSVLRHGKPITMNWLAKMLSEYREYGIKSEQLRIGAVTGKMGYHFIRFDRAWIALCPIPLRHIAPVNPTDPTMPNPSSLPLDLQTLHAASVDFPETNANHHEVADVEPVEFGATFHGRGDE